MDKKSQTRLKKRKELFAKQKKERGWDDSETWSLDHSLAKIILPRLKRFKELTNGYPSNETEESWNEKIDSMIFSFEFYATEPWGNHSKQLYKKVQKGLNLFAKYYGHLWW